MLPVPAGWQEDTVQSVLLTHFDVVLTSSKEAASSSRQIHNLIQNAAIQPHVPKAGVSYSPRSQPHTLISDLFKIIQLNVHELNTVKHGLSDPGRVHFEMLFK